MNNVLLAVRSLGNSAFVEIGMFVDFGKGFRPIDFDKLAKLYDNSEIFLPGIFAGVFDRVVKLDGVLSNVLAKKHLSAVVAGSDYMDIRDKELGVFVNDVDFSFNVEDFILPAPDGVEA